MTEERVTYTIAETGADRTAAGFTKVATAIGGAEKQQGSFNAKVSGSTMVLQDLGMALGRNSPQVMQFTQVIAGARSSLMGLTAALGGPMGLAVGLGAAGVIAGMELFSRAQAEAAAATKLATEQIEKQQQAIAALSGDLARAAGIQGGSEADALRARIRSSGATGSEKARLELLAQMAEDRAFEQQNSAELAKVNAAEASMGRGGTRRSANALGDSSNDFMSVAEQRRLAEKRAGGGKDDLDSFIADQAKAGDFEIQHEADTQKEITKIHEEETKRRIELEEEHAKAASDARKANVQMLVTTGAAGAAALGQQLAAMSRGQKASARAILATVGEAAVGTGTMGLLESAMMATNPLTIGFAPAHLAASLALIAGGMSLGAASAAGGGKSTGGGMSISRPVPSVNGGGGDGGGTTYINIAMPSVVSPGPDDGVRVVQALERANAVHGTKINKRSIEA